MNVGSELAIYLRLGLHHILDLGAIDHLLYLTIMAIPFVWQDWRRVVVLVTGFTLGHSLTLALAALGLIRLSPPLVEVLIPVTILITAVLVVWRNRRAGTGVTPVHFGVTSYILPAGFGLIHGLGFASYLRSLLGIEESILWPLLWFNLGLEAAQLLIVAAVLSTTFLVTGRVLDRRVWQLAVGSVTIAWSARMIGERLVSALKPVP